MSSRNDIEKNSNLSVVMQKMSDTLNALNAAFDKAMGLQDPMDHTQHEIWKINKTGAKKLQLIDF